MNILKVITKNRATGNLGEDAAARHLVLHGYQILERNFVADNAEVDIIAKKKNTIAFIEVKTRNVKYLGYKEARPGSSVTPEKQKKIIKAASRYVGFKHSELRKRFDVIEVYLETADGDTRIKEIRHLENTFDLSTAYKRNAY